MTGFRLLAEDALCGLSLPYSVGGEYATLEEAQATADRYLRETTSVQARKDGAVDRVWIVAPGGGRTLHVENTHMASVTVTGCTDCPFMREFRYCGARTEDVPMGDQDAIHSCVLAHGGTPEWCPLRKSELRVRLG